MSKLDRGETHVRTKLFQCSKCHNGFLERSTVCPRCDTKTMGQLKPLPEADREKFKAGEIRRLRRKHGV